MLDFGQFFCIYPSEVIVSVEFTHLDQYDQARMVDVTPKSATVREAIARGVVCMNPETVRTIEAQNVSKGDVYGVAKIAAIMAAKKTSGIIPLCHPLELTGIEVEFHSDVEKGEVAIQAAVRTVGRTGVEMEAMTAVSVAALTIYDMCKSADRGIVLSDIKLVRKSGGKSGTYIRPE